MSDNINNIDGIKRIEKMYKNLTYFDQYGGSVINLILITLILILICAYCYVMMHAKEIKANWQKEKCKPLVVPFAGFINAPKGTSWFDYTSKNFQQCLISVQQSIAGDSLAPLTFLTNSMATLMKNAFEALDNIRIMFDRLRNNFKSVMTEIMERLMNIMVPLQQIIINLRDFIGKCQGVMVAGLYTGLGSFYALQALMGAIAELVAKILVTLAAAILILWAVPATSGFAGAMTAVYVTFAIPMVAVLGFMDKYLKVSPNLEIPVIKCFDKNTQLLLDDGTTKKIMDIKIGDKLVNNNEVTAVIKVTSTNSIMHRLNDVIVSDSHIVKYGDKWLHVSEHPDSVILDDYSEDILYCLNTRNKTIIINNVVFADWDDLYGEILTEFIHKNKLSSCSEIHNKLDGGFHPNTYISLENGEHKYIKDIKIGEVLQNNVLVYGIVELDGTSLNEKYQINLGNGTIIKGGGNLNVGDSKIEYTYSLDENSEDTSIDKCKYTKLYHLLTNKNNFWVNNCKFFDYNACIDLFLDST